MKNRILLASPLLVIAIGFLVSRAFAPFLGTLTWLPLTVSLWGLYLLLGRWHSGSAYRKDWFRADGRTPPKWIALNVVVALLPLPMIFLFRDRIGDPGLLLGCLAFAVINAPLEEGYWRGVLGDVTSKWPALPSALFGSVFFSLNHLTGYGTTSIANRHPVTLASTFLMGLVWSLTWRATRSLRWPILSHFVVDLLNLSLFVFLNLVVPTDFSTYR